MTGFWWIRYKHCDRGHFGNQLTTQHIEKTLYAKPYRLKNWSAKKIVHILTLLDQKEIWKIYVTSHFLGNVMLKLNLKINDFLIYLPCRGKRYSIENAFSICLL